MTATANPLASIDLIARAQSGDEAALNDLATFAGLSVVSDLMAGTDRFLSFN